MRTTEEKLTVATAGFVILFFVSISMLSKDVRKTTAVMVEDLVYEMPRPTKILQSIFDLSSREIVRIVKGLKGNSKNDIDSRKSQPNSAPVSGNNLNSAKATANTAAKNTADQSGKAKTTQASWNQMDRSKLPTVVSDAAGTEATRAALAAGAAPTPLTDEEAFGPLANDPTVASPGEFPDLEKKKDKQNSQAKRWKDLLRSEPTMTNVRLLQEAVAKEEVSSTTYFEIMQELIRSEKPEAQQAGIYGLENTQSLTTFTMISEAYDKLDPANQRLAEEHLATYSQQSRLPILLGAMRGNSSPTILKAGEVLSRALIQVKSPAPGGDRLPSGRNARTQPPPSSASAYAPFVPVLEKLGKSPQYSEMSQHLLAQIESLPQSQ